MNSYLSHMKNIGDDKTFGRRAQYIKYNFDTYLDQLKISSKILEIGPGTGELLYTLNNLGIKNIDIIDNDQSVLDYCASKFKIRNSILSKSLDLSKSISNKYDLIVLTQVFEHIPKTSYLNWIRTMYSSLKPDGKIIITVPNGANPLSGTERYGDLQHENIFTVFSFSELMTFANLKKSDYLVRGFEIPPSSIINIIRIIMQKILHGIFIVLMIINGAIYQTLMTPNITLVITKDKNK